MNYSFHPEAENEFNESINYYENYEKNLGYEFAREVYNAIKSIVEYPKTWPVLDYGIRRRLIHRFPYAILYYEETKYVYILAVMHLSRDPDYWKKRLK
jgi:plasmid stabilization system protein ParE